jgi:hypothetical protein
MPPELKEVSHPAWLQIAVTASRIVVALDLAANRISSRKLAISALVTAVLFAVLVGLAVYSTGELYDHRPSRDAPPVSPQTTP